jgi:von Willebrand factor type A domain
MRRGLFNNVILSEAKRSDSGVLRSRRISCIHTRSFDSVCPSFVGSNSAQDDNINLFFARILIAVFFLITGAYHLSAQPITIELNNPKAALLQTDSTNWNEAWIELSGVSPGEKLTTDDLTIANGNRMAEMLSVDSIGWKFHSTLALSFVLDNSGSMFHAFDSLTSVCDSMVNILPAGAIGQAVTFDTRYRGPSHLYTSRSSVFIAQHGFTDSMAALSRFWHFYDTIRTQFTPLYDAIGVAVTNITARRERGDYAHSDTAHNDTAHNDTAHNDVLIVVTDGEDNASRASIELLQRLLASAHLRLFAINFRTEEDNRLEWLARKTGGEYFTASNIGELRELLQFIGLSLTQQYHVRYRFPTLGPSSGH